MKKLWGILVQTLALNFVIVAAGVGWLYKSGRLDKARSMAIKEVLFPKPVPPAAPVTDPAAAATTQPFLRLDTLLEKHAGKRAGDQVEAIQQTFDVQSAVLDRRRRELDDLQAQVAREKERLARESAALEADRQDLAARRQQTEQAIGDKGFDDSLQLYSTMPGKQVKSVFMSLPDDTVVRYLQAMPPRTATRIVKEFKSPEELDRINRVLERMRQGRPTTRPASGDGVADGAADAAATAAAQPPGAGITKEPKDR